MSKKKITTQPDCHADCDECSESNNKKGKKHKQPPKPSSIHLSFRKLILIWVSVGVFVLTLLTISQILFKTGHGNIIEAPTFQIMSVTIAFATFVMTSLFSVAILNHNFMTRELNESNRRFPTLQFLTSSFAMAEFVDYILLYQEYSNYIEDLKQNKNFNFYMREDDSSMDDIIKNLDDYLYLTIVMPIKMNHLKPPVTAIKFSRFKFVKGEKIFKFVPCSAQNSTLILFNDADNRSEVTCNLIVKKTSDFFKAGDLNPFNKMRVNVSVTSLIGVVTSGWAELYFKNPQKLEESGANKYKLRSSQFKATGLPSLEAAIANEIANMGK